MIFEGYRMHMNPRWMDPGMVPCPWCWELAVTASGREWSSETKRPEPPTWRARVTAPPYRATSQIWVCGDSHFENPRLCWSRLTFSWRHSQRPNLAQRPRTATEWWTAISPSLSLKTSSAPVLVSS